MERKDVKAMKITFEFDGDTEREEAERVLRVSEPFSLLWDIDQRLRDIQKYHSDEEKPTKEELIEELRGMIHENNILDLYS